MNAYREAYMFQQWVKRNPDAWRALYKKAHELRTKKGFVSANYLVNWLRNDTTIRIDGLDAHNFKTPNHFAPLLGRYLSQDAELRRCIKCKHSIFDEIELPEIPLPRVVIV